MPDVLHLCHNFLTDVTPFLVADPALTDLRHRCGLVNVNAVNRDTGLGSQDIPGATIDRCRAARR